MSDMVERVARALCDDTMKRWRSPIALKAEPWREFIPAARAAIEAMREPTEAMLHASYQIDGFWTDGPDHGDVYRAMIDASFSPTKD